MTTLAHFNSQSVAEVFRDLYLSEGTGILSLRGEEAEIRVYFGRGLIHYAESSVDGDSLGQTLIRKGHLSSGALAEAERNADGPEEVVQALLNRGLIGKRALRRTLRDLVDRLVRTVFQWEAGTATFEERESVPEFFDVDVLSTFEQILDGIASIDDFGAIREAMLGLDNRLALQRPGPIPLDRLTLSRTQGYVLSRVDGKTSFPDLISTLPPGEEETATRFLFGLLVMGAVDYEPRLAEGPFRVGNILRDHADRVALERMQARTIQQTYARMRTQNPHEVLGVTPHASRRAIERAYEEAKALFGRERLLAKICERYRSELGVIESRLIEAYLQLTQPERAERSRREVEEAQATDDLQVRDLLVRPELEKTRGRAAQDEAARIAELYYSKARQAMRTGDYHNAIQYGKLAISYKGRDARFYYMLADCQVRNPEVRWQRMAEENYTKATQLDPWNPQYRISLGRFYKKRGLPLRARRQFEEALKLVPEHEDATKELESLR